MFAFTFIDAKIFAYKMCVVFWVITYILLIIRGMKDKSYGMPILPLALNLAWEFTFLALLPPQGSADALLIPDGAVKAQVVFALCWLLDLGILYTYFRYGYRHMAESFHLTRGEWITYSLGFLVFGHLVVYYAATFFQGFERFFNHDQIEVAYFIAFTQNAIISIGFIAMYHMRNSLDGQSLYIALGKFIGTTLAVCPIYILKHPDVGYVWVIVATIVICDTWYVVLIWRALRRAGLNPWIRC